MSGAIPRITSNQEQTHPDLIPSLKRHLAVPYQYPCRADMQSIYQVLYQHVSDRPAILDAGCGRGQSTRLLAAQFPEHQIIGLDKSAQRLAHLKTSLPANAQIARLELIDFWLLAAADQWRFEKVYLLYPNPWPKAHHYKRRWQAHPIFPYLLASAKSLELRTNWRLYAEEFLLALQYLGLSATLETDFEVTEPLTAFEDKYQACGQTLYRVTLGPHSADWRADLGCFERANNS